MHRLNTELRVWIRTNDVYKREPQPSPGRIALARELQMLELHLNQWHDKYEALIPSDERRSVIYLADEKQQGIEFPKGLPKALEQAIEEGEAG